MGPKTKRTLAAGSLLFVAGMTAKLAAMTIVWTQGQMGTTLTLAAQAGEIACFTGTIILAGGFVAWTAQAFRKEQESKAQEPTS